MNGILYGIGVGPGEPELMTIKAAAAINASDVIILPTEPKEECYAYQIVKKIIPDIDKKEILCRHFPMTRDKKVLEEAHDKIYKDISEYLYKGLNVAFLTIGDPSLYSTYGYMQSRAQAHNLRTEVIAGVPSICAAAGRLGIALGDSNEKITIIPGSADLQETLDYSGTKVYMKSGKQLVLLKQLLMEEKEKYDVWAVANCGLQNEKCMTGIDELDTESGYLTVVIVKAHSS